MTKSCVAAEADDSKNFGWEENYCTSCSGEELPDDDFPDLDEFEFGNNDVNYFSQLCIPQDPLDEIEWYPNFRDELISLNDLSCFSSGVEKRKDFSSMPEHKDFPTTPEQENERKYEGTQKRGRDDGDDCGGVLVVSHKKQRRSKRWPKQHAWSLNVEMGINEDEELPPPPPSRSPSSSPSGDSSYWSKKRCVHCLTDKTPQWRIGPLGPKTLCNACGVRYKSGRLVPEYRPAASPTFNSLQHSNFHKKIMKRREGAPL